MEIGDLALSIDEVRIDPELKPQLLRFAFLGKTDYGLLVEGTIFRVEGTVFGSPLKKGAPVASLEEAKILAPSIPTKIVGVGFNFHSRLKELDIARPKEPLLFLKPPSAIVACYDSIVLPTDSEEVNMESEIGLIIGRRGKNVSENDVPKYVLGYTAANDITAADIIRSDVQATRSKSFDSFCPLGPFMTLGLPGSEVFIEGRLNGITVQHSTVADMIFSVPEVVAFVSQVMTLEQGDVILMGTPAGVSQMQAGDVAEVDVQGAGTLINPVIESVNES